MGQRSDCRPAALLLSIAVLAAGIACGQDQLDTTDVFSTSSFGLRRLSAYYARNFESQRPQKCYSSSYFSPYRLYFLSQTFPDFSTARFSFQLDVSSCPVSKAVCCGERLDHLLIRTAPNAGVTRVEVDGKAAAFNVSSKGLMIRGLDLNYTPLKSLQLSVFAPADDYERTGDLCPNSRFPDACDAIAYNKEETCCTERAALPRSLFFPDPPPPPGSGVQPGTTAPPPSPALSASPAPSPSPETSSPSPEPSVDPPSPPSPVPPSPAPPQPPPDGYDVCCIDDLPQAPYNLKYNGWKATGSDTAYLFQLIVRKVDPLYPDFDGPEVGHCSQMSLYDLGISIYDNLLVKEVLFDGMNYDYYTQPSAVDSKWVYLDLRRQLSDFEDGVPVDVVIIVRGRVDSLCPANDFLHSTAACEFAMHGKDNTTQCCPHGATKRGPPPDDCCVDDIEKSPYRMQFLRSNTLTNETSFDFAVKVVNVTGPDFDLEEPALCDHMTLDYAQIQIYKNIEVLEVTWEGRVMDFNTTVATDYSKWLNINGINRFVSDFDPSVPARFLITVASYVRELCPAGWLFDAGGATICEYALHGTQGLHTCCPHHITTPGTIVDDCGCRDDLPGTPYRLGYSPAAADANSTLFSFNLAAVDPNAVRDFDGAPDINQGLAVDCSAMGIKSVTFAVFKDLEVLAVLFNGFQYAWQIEPYTPTANWLKVLGIDYAASDFTPGQLVPLDVVVKGARPEMCPASALSGSQASCEYLVYGLDGYSKCCPRGVTSWLTDSIFG